MKNSRLKNICVPCLFVCICGYNILTPFVASASKERSKHISTGKILEFSLRNLREGLQKTNQKNDRLTFENAAIRKDIRYLKRMLERLSFKKSELLGGSPAFRYQEEPVLPIETFDTKEREQRTHQLIAIFERDVLVLQEKIQLLDNKLDQDQFNSQKQLLLGKKRENQASYSRSEKRLRSLEKKGRGPQKIIQGLEKEKSALEKKLAALKSRITGY